SVGGAGEGADARVKVVAAWRAWWRSSADKVDLDRLGDATRPMGLTLGIEYNTGRVWECDRAGKLRWQIRDLRGPMEAQVLPGGRVLVCESNGNTLSERDTTGKVLWQKGLGAFSPTGCQRLPNGNTFVSSYNAVLEFDRAGKELYRFNLPGGGSNA